jgi:hypothetical protein
VADASMVTMKILFNNKGISLVALLVAMTLITVLGASFVSLMSSKQKGFLHQIDSYRALNIANAGVEYAIRYVSDSLGDANSSYFQNLPTKLPDTSPYMPFNFAGGTFEVTRFFSYDMVQVSSNVDSIAVKSSFGGASRNVKLTCFRRYISALTLVPDPTMTYNQRRPNMSGGQVTLPVISNNENSMTVSRIDLRISIDNSYLQLIRFDGVTVFDYDTSTFEDCGTSSPPCKDTVNQGIRMPPNVDVSFNRISGLNEHLISTDTVRNYTFVFAETAPNGNYFTRFYRFDLVATTYVQLGAIGFTL